MKHKLFNGMSPADRAGSRCRFFCSLRYQSHGVQSATEVLEGTTALDAAVHELQRKVIHVLRTSTSGMDRRRYRRRPCLVEGTILCQGQSEAATLLDVSEAGCFARTARRCEVRQAVEISLGHFGMRLPGTVVATDEDGVRIAFSGEGLPAAEADRISLTTTAEMVKLVKDDHTAFVKRVVDAVAARDKLPPGSLATQHHCRLGRWYDYVTDPGTLALPSFKSIAEPHYEIHEAGRRALAAVVADDLTTAQRCVAEMRQHSEHVLHCLDDFGRAFPTTIGADRSDTAVAA